MTLQEAISSGYVFINPHSVPGFIDAFGVANASNYPNDVYSLSTGGSLSYGAWGYGDVDSVIIWAWTEEQYAWITNHVQGEIPQPLTLSNEGEILNSTTNNGSGEDEGYNDNGSTGDGENASFGSGLFPLFNMRLFGVPAWLLLLLVLLLLPKKRKK